MHRRRDPVVEDGWRHRRGPLMRNVRQKVMKQQPNTHVARKAENIWTAGHSNNWFELFFRFIGASSKPDVIYVLQYALGDWGNAKCTGDPIHNWEFRGTDFRLVDSIGTIDNANMIASRTPVLRYCLDDQSTRMIVNVWRGMRAEHGLILTFTGDCWKPDSLKWKS